MGSRKSSRARPPPHRRTRRRPASAKSIFTSGATESDNLALKEKGAMEACRRKGNHLVTMATEHKAVLDTVKHLERQGCQVTILPPKPDGLLDLASLRTALRPETVLVSVMYANNEIGTIQPVSAIGALCREKGVLFHCDAVQAFGKIPLDVDRDLIDLMSLSAHKMYGPKGIGALYVRRRKPAAPLTAQMDGGGHEAGMRSGTLNVPAIVGFGEACRLCALEMETESARVGALRDRLLALLQAGLEGVAVNGTMQHSPPRQPGMLDLRRRRRRVISSSHSPKLPSPQAPPAPPPSPWRPSHVLQALGMDRRHAQASVRLGGDWAASTRPKKSNRLPPSSSRPSAAFRQPFGLTGWE